MKTILPFQKAKLLCVLLLLISNISHSQTVLDEKFEGTTMPTGWTFQSTISDPNYSYTWEFFDAYDDVEVYTSPTKTQNEWLISPSFNLTSYSNLYLTFSPWIYINRADFAANVFDFNVLVSSDGGVNWATIWSDNLLDLNNFDQKAFYYRTITKSLKNYCGLNMNNVKIAFQFTGNGKASTYLNFVALMDVKISSDCPVTTLSKLNSNSISWFAVDDFSGTYEIEYGALGFSPGTGTTVNGLSGTTYVFPSLMGKYDCYIRTNCGGSTSGWNKMTFSNTIQEVTTNQTTSNSSTISWLGYSELYQIEYGLGNFTQGTGIILDDITGQSYTFTGLIPNSNYKYYIRSKSVTSSQNTANTKLQKKQATDFGPWTSGTFTTTTLSINNTVFNNKFSLSPNPTNNILNIEIQEPIKAINIINIAGQTIKIKNFANKQIDVSTLQNGIYFIEIITEKGSHLEKFIKK